MARGAFRAVDQRPDPVSRFNLGVLMEARGDLAAAEQAYRTADSRGHAAAAVNLGVLLESHGDIQGAEASYRRAQKRGEPNGAFNLGVLLEERGDGAGAERAYRFADQHGHAAAACNLGAMLAERGDISDAEAAFKRADERGEPNAAVNLAMLRGIAAATDRTSPAVQESETAIPADRVERGKTNTHRRPERSHAQQDLADRRRVTPRRAALVLVPAAFAVAAVLAFNSTSMKAPKRTVSTAAITANANLRSLTAAGSAPPHLVPARSSVRPAGERAPRQGVAHSSRARPTAHPRHASSPPAHVLAPSPLPPTARRRTSRAAAAARAPARPPVRAAPVCRAVRRRTIGCPAGHLEVARVMHPRVGRDGTGPPRTGPGRSRTGPGLLESNRELLERDRKFLERTFNRINPDRTRLDDSLLERDQTASDGG